MAKANKANKVAAVEASNVRVVRFQPGTIKVEVANLNRMVNISRPEGIKADKALLVLEASIALLGVQDPVIVAKDEDGTYTLVAGNRRVECVERLMKRGSHDGVIDAKVLVDGSPAGRALANLVENEQPGRADITWLGRAAGYEELLAQGMSKREIAEAVGRAEDVVRDVLRIGGADPRCKAALEAEVAGKPVKVTAPVYRHADGKWTLSTDKDGNAREVEVEQQAVVWGVVRLVMRKPVEEQADWLRKVAGLSVPKAAALLNGKPVEKPAAPAAEGDEGEGEGEGGEGPGRVEGDKSLDALRDMVAKGMVPLLFAANARHGAIIDGIKADDTDAALAAGVKLGEALQAMAKVLVGLVGQDRLTREVEAAKADAKR